MIAKHLDKNNLHHAYLIEGERDEIIPEVILFLNDIGIKTINNPDFVHIHLDSFKIDDARNLKSYSTQTGDIDAKKIFIISTNNFLLEAQNTLLKMFEEPILNTHFFLVVPDVDSLLKTFISRFYVISPRQPARNAFSIADAGGGLGEYATTADKFISMPLSKRIDFVKELLLEEEESDEEGAEVVALDSTRSKALKFINALEFSLHQKLLSGTVLDTQLFDHIFKVRKFLRMPGSSTKSLLESVALTIPNF